MGKKQFTKEGFEKIKQEYADLQISRKPAVEDLKKAREMGDLSENGYYKGARAKLSSIDRQLRFLKHLISIAEVAETPDEQIVAIGKIVTLSDGKNTKQFSIVGSFESNPSEGKISLDSPLGKLLKDKAIKDTIDHIHLQGKTTYTIIEIR